jgi:hypothetical protein
LSRYWLTPAYEADFDDKVTDINEIYKQAPERAKQGQRTESIDEMTGVQALERKHPDLPMLSGKVELREFACTVPQAQVNINGMVLYLLPATLMLRMENWLPVQPTRHAMKKILWSISRTVSIQTR